MPERSPISRSRRRDPTVGRLTIFNRRNGAEGYRRIVEAHGERGEW